ncbi:hypothetical protein An09g04270 [Aspergillus niger]|uniref:Uncharacterized protein n=2 Tax=Aspergillus niger TaxID=5061 RepID=A2QU40_ASPNC|nr:hypothetical protein An09g04270 [Aspergillus niger]CAK96868.1 hypothetical protein An09g04270 [Aspergillus niger]
MAGSDTVLLLGILVDDIRHITRDGEGRRSCSHGKVDGSAHLEMNRDCVGGEAECEIGQLSELGGVFAPTHATPFGSATEWMASEDVITSAPGVLRVKPNTERSHGMPVLDQQY